MIVIGCKVEQDRPRLRACQNMAQTDSCLNTYLPYSKVVVDMIYNGWNPSIRTYFDELLFSVITLFEICKDCAVA